MNKFEINQNMLIYWLIYPIRVVIGRKIEYWQLSSIHKTWRLSIGGRFYLSPFWQLLGCVELRFKKRRVGFYIVYCGLLTRSVGEVYESFLMASSVTSMAQVKTKKRDRNQRKCIQINDSLLPFIQRAVNVLLQASIEEKKAIVVSSLLTFSGTTNVETKIRAARQNNNKKTR